jgi:YspA, cpYpsA-related SLOG family
MTLTMHVMVCGGRLHFLTPAEMDWLESLRRSLPMTALIPGGGKFVDAALTAWAYQAGVRVEPIPADWTGTTAHGPHRSLAYLKLLQTYLPPGSLGLLALPGGNGTAYLCAGAQRLGLPVLTYPEKETLMPEMTVTPPEDSPVPQLPDTNVPDDIPEPSLPDTLTATLDAQDAAGDMPAPPPAPDWQRHEALLQGFLGHLLHRLDAELISNGKDLLRTIDAMGQSVKTWVEAFSGHSEHAEYQLANMIERLMIHGMQLRQDPYQVEVQALSPQGYTVTLRLAKQTTPDLIESLPALLTWLEQQGYTPVAGGVSV